MDCTTQVSPYCFLNASYLNVVQYKYEMVFFISFPSFFSHYFQPCYVRCPLPDPLNCSIRAFPQDISLNREFRFQLNLFYLRLGLPGEIQKYFYLLNMATLLPLQLPVPSTYHSLYGWGLLACWEASYMGYVGVVQVIFIRLPYEDLYLLSECNGNSSSCFRLSPLLAVPFLGCHLSPFVSSCPDGHPTEE